MTELIIAVERLPDHDAYLVRASGWLGAWNRHDLRLTAQKCFVDLPSAVILDLTGLRLLDRLAAAVFVALRYDAANTGPGIKVLMCGVDDDYLRERIRLLLPEQDVHVTLDDAVTAIHESSEPTRWLFRRLPPGLPAPIEASAVMVEACQRWAVPHLLRRTRRTAFDLGLAALRCPPGPMSLTATLDVRRLRIGLRVQSTAESVHPCATRQAPLHYVHKRTDAGHILWTSWPVSPGKPAAAPPVD